MKVKVIHDKYLEAISGGGGEDETLQIGFINDPVKGVIQVSYISFADFSADDTKKVAKLISKDNAQGFNLVTVYNDPNLVGVQFAAAGYLAIGVGTGMDPALSLVNSSGTTSTIAI